MTVKPARDDSRLKPPEADLLVGLTDIEHDGARRGFCAVCAFRLLVVSHCPARFNSENERGCHQPG